MTLPPQTIWLECDSREPSPDGGPVDLTTGRTARWWRGAPVTFCVAIVANGDLLWDWDGVTGLRLTVAPVNGPLLIDKTLALSAIQEISLTQFRNRTAPQWAFNLTAEETSTLALAPGASARVRVALTAQPSGDVLGYAEGTIFARANDSGMAQPPPDYFYTKTQVDNLIAEAVGAIVGGAEYLPDVTTDDDERGLIGSWSYSENPPTRWQKIGVDPHVWITWPVNTGPPRTA